MHREIYESRYFTEGAIPKWRCPTCLKGTLNLHEKLFIANNAETRRHINEEYFEPDQVETVFNGALCCVNCGETVVFVGSGGVDRSYTNEDGDWEWESYYSPRFFYPPLKLIDMPADVVLPEEMTRAIEASFLVFWSNLDSCANRLRTVIELLLDAMGVERKVRPEVSKELTLHQRIERINAVQYPHVQNMLEAIKLVGNEGSHDLDQVAYADILSCYEILEHILELVYPPPSRTDLMVQLAQKMIQKKLNNTKIGEP